MDNSVTPESPWSFSEFDYDYDIISQPVTLG